eukprot:gene1115-10629_t
MKKKEKPLFPSLTIPENDLELQEGDLVPKLFPDVEIRKPKKIKKQDLFMIDKDLQHHTRMQDSVFNLNRNQKFEVKDLCKNLKDYFPIEVFEEVKKKRKRKFFEVSRRKIKKGEKGEEGGDEKEGDENDDDIEELHEHHSEEEVDDYTTNQNFDDDEGYDFDFGGTGGGGGGDEGKIQII